MTRLLEPYRVEHTIRVVDIRRSAQIPGAYVLAISDNGTEYARTNNRVYARGVPTVLLNMFTTHGALDVKVRRLENTQFIETILSIQKAR